MNRYCYERRELLDAAGVMRSVSIVSHDHPHTRAEGVDHPAAPQDYTEVRNLRHDGVWECCAIWWRHEIVGCVFAGVLHTLDETRADSHGIDLDEVFSELAGTPRQWVGQIIELASAEQVAELNAELHDLERCVGVVIARRVEQAQELRAHRRMIEALESSGRDVVSMFRPHVEINYTTPGPVRLPWPPITEQLAAL